jgi:hypothetical protein
MLWATANGPGPTYVKYGQFFSTQLVLGDRGVTVCACRTSPELGLDPPGLEPLAIKRTTLGGKARKEGSVGHRRWLVVLLVLLASCGRSSWAANLAAHTASDQGPILDSFEDSPHQVLLGEDVTFLLYWHGGEEQVRAVVCKTNEVEAGNCPGGAWAIGSPSAESPTTATFRVPSSVRFYNQTGGGEFFYPFVCDEQGRCSKPIQTSPTYCPYFDVVAERGDEPGPLECDQSPPVGGVDARTCTYPQPVVPAAFPLTQDPERGCDPDGTSFTPDGIPFGYFVHPIPGFTYLTARVGDENTSKPIPGAMVILTVPTLGEALVATSDRRGQVAFLNIPIGERGCVLGTIEVRAEGYSVLRLTNEAFRHASGGQWLPVGARGASTIDQGDRC